MKKPKARTSFRIGSTMLRRNQDLDDLPANVIKDLVKRGLAHAGDVEAPKAKTAKGLGKRPKRSSAE